MCCCAGSEMTPRALRVVVLGLALMLAAAPAWARHHRVIVHGTGGAPARHVTIDENGVTVVHADSATRDTFIDNEDAQGSVTVTGPGIHIDSDDEGEGIVKLFSDADVPPGRRVEGDVVAVFGSVDVSGAVSGDVVAVFGSVRLKPGASVGHDVVTVGGTLDRAPGASVGGQTVSVGLLPSALGVPALPLLIAIVFVSWLVTLFLAWLMQLMMPTQAARMTATAARHFVGSFFIGVLSFPVSVLAMALLFVTVVGIPVALLWPLFYMLMLWAGLVIGAAVLGSGLRRVRPGEGGLVGPAALGGLLIAVILIASAVMAGPQGALRSFALLFALVG